MNTIQYAAGLVRLGVRALRAVVFSRWPRTRSWFGGHLPDERDYGGLVGDGRGSSLLISCIGWIVNAFTQMKPTVFIENDDYAPDEERNHKAARLFRRPTYDPDLGRSHFTWLELIAGILISFIVDGNAYVLKVRGAGGAGRPVQLWYIPHWMLEPRWDPSDTRKFITGYDYYPDGQLAPGAISLATTDGPIYWVPVENIIHFRDGLDPDNTRKGLSKVKTLLREIYTDEEAARWTASLLRNHAVPGLVLSPKSPLSDKDDAERVKQKLSIEWGADRRGLPLIMGGPTEITPYGFSPDQMKLGDIRDVPEERVTAATGVKAAVVGFGAGLQSTKVGATMAELVDLSWQDGVLGRSRIIAATLTEQLLTEFDERAGEDAFMAFDMRGVPIMIDYHLKQAQRGEILFRSGIATRGEVKRELGMRRGERDDVYAINAGVTEVDSTKTLEETQQEAEERARAISDRAQAARERAALAEPKPQLALGDGQPAGDASRDGQKALELQHEERRADRATQLEMARIWASQRAPEMKIEAGAIQITLPPPPPPPATTVTIEEGAIQLRTETPAAPPPAPVPSEIHLHIDKVVEKIETHVDEGAVKIDHKSETVIAAGAIQAKTEIAEGAVKVGVMPPTADLDIVRDAEGKVAGVRRA